MPIRNLQGGLLLEGVEGLSGASAKLLCTVELMQVPGSYNHCRATDTGAIAEADNPEADDAGAIAEADNPEADDAGAIAEADDAEADDAEADSINNNSRSKIFSLSFFLSFEESNWGSV